MTTSILLEKSSKVVFAEKGIEGSFPKEKQLDHIHPPIHVHGFSFCYIVQVYVSCSYAWKMKKNCFGPTNLFEFSLFLTIATV